MDQNPFESPKLHDAERANSPEDQLPPKWPPYAAAASLVVAFLTWCVCPPFVPSARLLAEPLWAQILSIITMIANMTGLALGFWSLFCGRKMPCSIRAIAYTGIVLNFCLVAAWTMSAIRMFDFL